MRFLNIIYFLFFLMMGCGNNTPTPSDTIATSQSINVPTKAINTAIYTKQSFKTLAKFRILRNKFSSNYQIEDDSIINNQIPKEIKELNDTNIEISGYAFPIALEKGKCTAFVLMSILPNCCFGDNLKINEYIYIDALKDIKEIKNQQFITVKGKFSVGMTEVSTWGEKFLYTLVADEVNDKVNYEKKN